MSRNRGLSTHRNPFRAWAILAALNLFLAGRSVRAQISYRTEGIFSRQQTILPWHGPGAALLNPANLAETNLVYGLAGLHSSISGKGGYDLFQLGGAAPFGLAVGFAGTTNGSNIDQGNAVYQEQTYVPMLAFGWPAARNAPHRFSIGAALPIYAFDAFGANKSRSTGLDMGILLSVMPRPAMGRVRLGIVMTHLIEPEVELADNRGYYPISGETRPSLSWTSGGGRWDIHFSWFFRKVEREDGFPTEDSGGMDTWGIRFLPIDWLAFKVERPRLGSLATYGFELLAPPLAGIRSSLEFNAGHDKGVLPSWPPWLFGIAQDEGRGYLLSLSLAASY